jgi:hypothetical protein
MPLRRYPRLHLTIAQADMFSGVLRFRHCQRIIALREEGQPQTDELLGRLLRHRYVRLGGGIDGVKSQLDARLEAPGSIAVAPRRAVSRHGKGEAEPVSKIDWAMAGRLCRSPKQHAPLKIKGAAVEASLAITGDSDEFAMLLFQARPVLSASACADKVDAERWLTAWRDTPNIAVCSMRSQCLIKQMHGMQAINNSPSEQLIAKQIT